MLSWRDLSRMPASTAAGAGPPNCGACVGGRRMSADAAQNL